MAVHPSRLLEAATLPDRLTYYWQVLAPVAFFPWPPRWSCSSRCPRR